MIGCKGFSDKELDTILKSLDNRRDYLIVLLGVKTGFRISELLSIKVNDLMEGNAIKSSITVFKRNMKGKHQSRSIPLSESTRDALKRYIATLPSRQDWLFQSRKGGRLTRVQGYRIIHNAAKAVGIEGKIGSHSMRKTFASRIYNALNHDILKTSLAMGHSRIDNTVKYLSINMEEINNAIKGI